MFDFLKSSARGSDRADAILEKMMERSQRFVVTGRQIADDCFDDALKVGKFTTLSSMDRHIRANHGYNTEAVINGFLTRIQEYVTAEQIVHVAMEGGDFLLAHRDHAASIVQRLQAGGVDEGATEKDAAADDAGPHRAIIEGQERLARQISLFMAEINEAAPALGKIFEGVLPAARAIEMLSQRKGERADATSGWTLKAALGYSGGNRQGYIRVEDPELVSYLQLDNPKLYVTIGGQTRRLFGRGDHYQGYFAFSYYIHSGTLESPDKAYRDDLSAINDIRSKSGLPNSLPELFRGAGRQDLLKRWMEISKQTSPS